ncbi:MAG: rRNA adenine N(6)-methyltransferase family protein [Acidimicrobiales bacterium]
MAERERNGSGTSRRGRQRRDLGQNFLVDDRLISRFVAGLDLGPGDLVVDIGAGAGALTLPLARTGAEVWAVEADPAWAARLRHTAGRAELADAVRVVEADLRRLRLPRNRPYRVVANPPFGLTSEVLGLLFDDPGRGPVRADLILQQEVARRHATSPPSALRTAAWAPWWRFELGLRIGREAFRPRPSVDARVLTASRRDGDDVLPLWLAPTFLDLLRPAWGRAGRTGDDG